MAINMNKTHPWFQICHPRPTAKYQVFVFPSAGSPDPSYNEWDKHFPECEFSIIMYPGRSTRMSEKLLTSLGEYVTELNKGLVPFITKPCIFIGHSIGTAISFAIAKDMVEKKNKGNYIKFLVELGRGPPHLLDPDETYDNMTDAQIVEQLKQIADPKNREIYNYPEFVEMLLPPLKADSKVNNVNDLLPAIPIDIPIIVYGGVKEENVDEAFLNRWKELTTKTDLFLVRMFQGHHNFQTECQNEVLQFLKQDFNTFINNTKA